MSVAEIVAAILRLTGHEFAELMAWLRQYEENAWDKQIEADIASGRLNNVLSDANKALS